jgi:transcriptional regulator with XRE-family HTH domain
MTGADLRAIRQKLGLTPDEFGRALGYRGPSARVTVHQLETGKTITRQVERLAEMFARHGVPRRYLADHHSA